MSIWDHISYGVVDWEARSVCWQAGCRAALQPIQDLTLNLPKHWKIGQNFPAGCILLLPSLSRRWLAGVLPAEASPPSQSCAGWFALLSRLSQPPYPLYDTWLQTTCLFDLPPTKCYLLSSLPPSYLFCRKLCISGLLNIQRGGMLNCLLWRRSLPRGTSASASYHVLVSQRMSNNN